MSQTIAMSERCRVTGQGIHWIRESTRCAIYVRDGWCCVYCGATAEDGATLSLDHLQPSSLGGSNATSNLITCCTLCNSRRRALSLRSWYALLRDDGIDTAAIAARVRRHVARPLDRAEGRRLAALRHGD